MTNLKKIGNDFYGTKNSAEVQNGVAAPNIAPNTVQLGNIIFGNGSTSYTLLSLQVFNPAAINLKTEPTPQDRGRTKTDDTDDLKTISLKISIDGSDQKDFEFLVDNLVAEASKEELYFWCWQSGKIRQFKVRWQNQRSIFPERAHWQINYSEAKIELVVLDPYGTDTERKVSDNLASTGLNSIFEVNNNGNAPCRPLFWFYFSEAENLTSFRIDNLTTNQAVKITRNFTATDILEIDGDKKEMRVNGEKVEYEGHILDALESGTNQIQFQFEGGTDPSVKYNWSLRFLQSFR